MSLVEALLSTVVINPSMQMALLRKRKIHGAKRLAAKAVGQYLG